MYSDLSEGLGWKVLELRFPSELAAAVGGGEEGHGKAEVGVVPEKLLFLPGAGLAKIIYSLRYAGVFR